MSDIDSERDSQSETSSSSSEEEAEEVIRSRVPALSVTRERRANAGSKMGNLIKDYAALTADADADFYNTAYGGFDEDGDDEEFDEKMEEADDELDSDFDAEETEDVADAVDDQDEDNGRKRSSRRKEAYEISADRRKAAAKKTTPKPKAKPKAQPQRRPAERTAVRRSADPVTRAVVDEFLGKRSLRERKPALRDEDEEPVSKKSKSRSSRNRSSRRSKVEDEKKVWTQAELLEEAKETERENLASLHKYQLLELEKNEAKKRAKKSSREIAGPFIRSVSTKMPAVEEADPQDPDSVIRFKTERTFITFSDEQVKQQTFAGTKPQSRKRICPPDVKRGQAICPISGLRARYFDPVSRMPFASSTTYHVLRGAYCNQLLAFFGNVKSGTSVVSAEGDTPPMSPAARKKDELQVWLDWKRAQIVRSSSAS